MAKTGQAQVPCRPVTGHRCDSRWILARQTGEGKIVVRENEQKGTGRTEDDSSPPVGHGLSSRSPGKSSTTPCCTSSPRTCTPEPQPPSPISIRVSRHRRSSAGMLRGVRTAPLAAASAQRMLPSAACGASPLPRCSVRRPYPGGRPYLFHPGHRSYFTRSRAPSAFASISASRKLCVGRGVTSLPCRLRSSTGPSSACLLSSHHHHLTLGSLSSSSRDFSASRVAMTATKIDGTAIAKSIRERLKAEIQQIQESNPRFKPSLVIFQGS